MVNGVQFLGALVEASSADMLRQFALTVKDQLTAPYLVTLAANAGGKAQVTVLLSDNLVKDKGLNAQKIIKEQVAPLIKGGGGGQPTLATAGGQDAGNLTAVIEKVKGLL
jgi:alanyl-tRNA synthetase